MKKALLLLATPTLLFLFSCGGPKKEETVAATPGMMETSFKINGNNLSIMVPDSTKGKMELVEQPSGVTEIKVGADFQISIEGGDGDVALMKSDIAGNQVFKLQQYLKDEPTFLFWDSKNNDLPGPRFHFYLVSKIGTVSYIIKDIDNGDVYNEKTVQSMIDAAKTLKAKANVKANS
jgi:hypothetical protein